MKRLLFVFFAVAAGCSTGGLRKAANARCLYMQALQMIPKVDLAGQLMAGLNLHD